MKVLLRALPVAAVGLVVYFVFLRGPDPRLLDDRRHSRLITLDNKMDIFLVSDPETKVSAVSVDVGVGGFEDPTEHEGVAHFVEHLLFLGSEKYPDPSSFDAYISRFQGYNNAFTSTEHTNYQLELNHEGLEEGMDRLAQFFVSPLFAEDLIEKERNAVDSEHDKSLQMDDWRIHRVDTWLSRPGHPRQKYIGGNTSTLKGLKTEFFKKFHSDHYSANIMKAVVVSKYDLATLEKWARASFSAVPNKNVTKTKYDPEFIEAGALPRLVYVKPLTEKRNLTLSFPAPTAQGYWREKPLDLITSVIGDEGEGSLLSLLKKEGLATGLGAGEDVNSYGSTIGVDIVLTEKGLKNYQVVLRHFFEFAALLRAQGIPKELFEQERGLKQVKYDYREGQEGANFAAGLASVMQETGSRDPERESYLLYEYNDALIKEFISGLQPRNMQAMVVDKGVTTDKVEHHFNVPYRVEKLPEDLVKSLESVAPNSAMHLPKLNPYLPKNLKLLAHPSHTHPTKVMDSNRGKVWLQQDKDVLLPKAQVTFKIFTPVAHGGNARDHLLAKLYTEVFAEAANEWKYTVERAGLGFSFLKGDRALALVFSGFNEHLPALMLDVINRLDNVSITPERFDAIIDGYKRDIDSIPYSDAYSQNIRQLRYLLNRDVVHYTEIRPLLNTVTLDDVRNFVPKVYEKIGIEVVAYGHVEEQSIVNAIDLIFAKFGSKEFPQSEWPDGSINKLQPGKPFGTVVRSKSNNHAYTANIQISEPNPKVEGLARIGTSILDQKFYADLRTQQQLGYIVALSSDFGRDVISVAPIIQSAKYDARQIEERVDAWLARVPELLKNLSADEFASAREQAVLALERPDVGIQDKFNRLDRDVFEHRENFAYEKEMIESMKLVSQAEVVEFFENNLKPDARKELRAYHVADGAKDIDLGPALIKDPKTFRQSLDIF